MRLPFVTSLYGRIFAIFWLTMLIVLIAALTLPFLDPRLPHDIPKNHFNRTQQFILSLEERYADHPNLQKIAQQLSGRGSQHNGKRPLTYITDLEGNLITREHGPINKIMQNFITGIDLTHTQPQQKLYGRMMLSGPFSAHIAHQEVLLFSAIRWHQAPHFLVKLVDKPLQLLFVMMAASTPFLFWLAWALGQPARRLENAAKRVAKGEFVADPALEKGTKEFQQAGASFNQMVLAVDHMITGQQLLLSNISHELRSPLTRLRMANALAKRKQGASDELQRIDIEAERLEEMISELLKLSRMQIQSHENRECISVKNLWQNILKDAQFEAEQDNKSLSYNAFPSVSVYGNSNQLMSAVENIIRNAIYYSHQTIQISMSLATDEIHIHVDDDGDGVPEGELDDIFRPFYRVSTSRERHSGGTGLGLAIAESAIHQHNGSIRAETSPLGGLKVRIILPISEQQ